MKKVTLAVLLSVGLMTVTGVALANSSDVVSFHLGKNLFVAGTDVTVKDDVVGDLYVAGQTVQVEGKVGGDLMFGAMTATVDGDVAGSVRGGAQTVNLNGSVGKTTLLGANSANVNAGEKATANDVMIGAAMVSIDRPVAGDLAVGATDLRLNKPVTGAATFALNTLSADDAATIAGKVTYYAQAANDTNQQRLEQLAPQRVTFQLKTQETNTTNTSVNSGFILLARLALLLSVLVIGWAALKLAPKLGEGLMKAQRQQYVLSLIMGVIFIPLMVIVLIVLSISQLLLPLALVIAAALPLVVLYSLSVVYRNVGEMLQKGRADRPVLSILIGGVLLAILASIPFLNVIVGMVVMLLTTGSLLVHLFNSVGLLHPASK